MTQDAFTTRDALIDAALAYLGSDPTNERYLPVSLRTRSDMTWAQLWNHGLVSTIEVVEAATFKLKAISRGWEGKNHD